MIEDGLKSHVTPCKNASWSEFHRSLKGNNFIYLHCEHYVKVRRFNDKSIIINAETRVTQESNLVSEIGGYDSHTIDRVGWPGGSIKLFHPDYISVEVLNNFFYIWTLILKSFFKAVVSGSGNTYVTHFHRRIRLYK